MLLDCVASWNLQWTTSVMCEVHHHDKLRFFDLVKGLVAHNNPFGKMLLEFFLVPRPLLINQWGVRVEKILSLTAARAC